MIITCEQCQTSFRLDDDNIKAPFTKVRCSQCQHIFQVSPPELAETPQPPPQTELDLSSFLKLAEDETSAATAPVPGESPATLAPQTQAPSADGNRAPGVPPAQEFQPLEQRRSLLLLDFGKWLSSSWLWLGVGVLVFGLAAGSVWWYKRGPGKTAPHPPSPMAAAAPTTAEPPPTKVTAPPATAPAPAPQEVRDLHIVDYEGLYEGLHNAQGGNLLVIRGAIKNTGTVPRGPVTLQATLNNPEHKPIMTQTCIAGINFTSEELRTWEPAKLTKRQESGPPDVEQQIVAPGKTLPFMVVFFGVPKVLAGYVFDLKIIHAPAVTPTPGKS